MINIKNLKGKYLKSTLDEKILFHDQPTTSSQDIVCLKTNDTSSDLGYPSNRYISTKNLGDGSASLIFQGYDNVSQKKVILKKISKRENWRKELEAIQKLSSNSSGKLLKYIDFFESQRFSYIITDFYEGYDLFEHIDLNVPYSIEDGLLLGLEMAKCIKECHDNNIVHLDIKFENYMVKNSNLFMNGKPEIVLIDFGHAEIISEDKSIEYLEYGYNYGTKYFICPEGYVRGYYSSKSDIWSLGICFAILFTGNHPYAGRGRQYYRNSALNNITLTEWVPPDVVDLLRSMLQCSPFKRPTIDELIANIEDLLNEMR